MEDVVVINITDDRTGRSLNLNSVEYGVPRVKAVCASSVTIGSDSVNNHRKKRLFGRNIGIGVGWNMKANFTVSVIREFRGR